ncbi:MAG: antitoxin HicB [Anaerolinea sp.]|nr:antitoxin HicB [Anaerolinea sp.]
MDIVCEGITFHFAEMEEGGYLASVPDLPDAVSSGLTLDEAFANAHEALELVIESSAEWGLAVPERFAERAVQSA